ncbi:hypothetical protein GCM10020000_75820 [Streptomyces olivoverticillatus]
MRIAFDPAAKAAFKEARVAERRLPAELGRLSLPQEGPEHLRALYDASSFRDFADGPLPAEGLLDLLATLARGELDGRGKHRYPSAGGFYPVQVYLYVSPGAVAGIDGGLHYLHPGERTLVAVDPAARMGTDVHVFHNRALVEGASFGLFLVSTPAAIAPAYGQANASRFSTIEASHIAQLLLTAAPQRGLGMCAVGEMNFDAVRGHFGLDDDQELLLSLWGGQLTAEARERRAGLVAQEQPAAGAPAPAAAKADRAVAVIGFAARLPGADTLDELDALLADGRSATRPVPSERWAPLTSRAGRAGARVGGYLADVTAVEADEFGLGGEETAAVDPQERLLLSVARHCFEDAAVTPRQLSEAGSVGVFVGSMWQDHALYGVTARADGRPGTHATRGGLAHRTSHAFGLTGPSLVLDTGCVSGLAAVEAAYRAVADGRCEAALAAGSNLVLHPDHLDVLSDMGLVAEQPDSCALTDRASGWIVGEGVGAVLLKPLDRALADGDPIHAVLRGGALVHSGTTRQFGIPDPKRQEEVMRTALADASLTPGDIGYVEAAAAGAALADVLEFGAVDRLFTGQEQPVPVGSVKPNTGHLEAASVFAQLGKVILQFRREELYPTRLTSAPNPALNGRTGAVLATAPEGTRWRTADGGPRRALVNGFAGGGSYGSLVVEEPPAGSGRRRRRRARERVRTAVVRGQRRQPRPPGRLPRRGARPRPAAHPGRGRPHPAGGPYGPRRPRRGGRRPEPGRGRAARPRRADPPPGPGHRRGVVARHGRRAHRPGRLAGRYGAAVVGRAGRHAPGRPARRSAGGPARPAADPVHRTRRARDLRPGEHAEHGVHGAHALRPDGPDRGRGDGHARRADHARRRPVRHGRHQPPTAADRRPGDRRGRPRAHPGNPLHRPPTSAPSPRWRSPSRQPSDVTTERRQLIIMTRIFMFPGQGAQRVGMGRELFDRFPHLEAEASEVLGYSLRTLCLEDPEGQLGNTRYTQPAMYAVNALAHRAAVEDGDRPDVAIGHSLGEYNALEAAGVFGFADGLRLVAARARAMADVTGGGMSAVVGLPETKLRFLLLRAGFADLDMANLNTAAQTVLAGPVEDLEEAGQILEDAGARMVRRLAVSGPFHSRYMAPAAAALAPRDPLGPPRRPPR